MIEYSDWKNRIYPAGGRLSAAPILIDDGASPSILEIRAKLTDQEEPRRGIEIKVNAVGRPAAAKR